MKSSSRRSRQVPQSGAAVLGDVQKERELHYLRMLEEQGVRGIIVNPVIERLDGLVRLSSRGVPVVLLDRPRRKEDLCAVAVDNVRGGRLAVGVRALMLGQHITKRPRPRPSRIRP